VFFSALGASTQSRARVLRAKALAEQAVRESDLVSTVFAPSMIYAPGDAFLTRLARLALLPAVMPFPGRGRARLEPIWVADVADCVMATLRSDVASARYELAGPDVLTHEQIVALALRSFGRRRAFVHIPTAVVSRILLLLEQLGGPRAFATWDEVELMEVTRVAAEGTTDAGRLGVHPRSMAAVLGVS
jgi:NADH dehydrogenase